jgi:outer membrane protein assembly factor BamA
LRIFEDQVSLFSYFPLSQTRRFELGGGWLKYYYRLDRINNYYYLGLPVKQDKGKLPSPKGYSVEQVYGAYVFDNSSFGIASPLDGARYRLEFGSYFGGYNFQSFLLDYRKYFWLKPVSLAFRLYQYYRFGDDAESTLSPLYIGYPTLVRGYNSGSFSNSNSIGDSFSINQLAGSRIAVGNIEVRVPFSGPKRLSLIKSGVLFTELAGFLDSGLAWDSRSSVTLEGNTMAANKRFPVFSTGLSARVNLFGYLVVEPYYAFPLNRHLDKGVFGINFTPGW